MALPDISVLDIGGTTTEKLFDTTKSGIDDPIGTSSRDDSSDDHYLRKFKSYAQSLPYSIEPLSKMQQLLDLIVLRISQCVEAKDYDVGLLQWDSMLT
jgi:proteasome activator subunit 4